MATWVTHLMIADKVLALFPSLDNRGFCVGNIAPDCNVENADWTAYTPPKKVTHWMQGDEKTVSGAEAFYDDYILKRRNEIKSNEEYSFLLGYYCHLVSDAAFMSMVRDKERIKAVWNRIKADSELCSLGANMEETWDNAKRLIPQNVRMQEIYTIEAEYLRDNPNSGYITEILSLKEFPDYIDYLPSGCIVRKIGVMGYMPKVGDNSRYITLSRREYTEFVDGTVEFVAELFEEKILWIKNNI